MLLAALLLLLSSSPSSSSSPPAAPLRGAGLRGAGSRGANGVSTTFARVPLRSLLVRSGGPRPLLEELRGAVAAPQRWVTHDDFAERRDTYPAAAREHEVRIRNYDEMQFFGELGVGTPPQLISVVFDTGSGHMIIKGAACTHCQGGDDPGYDRTKSSSYRKTDLPMGVHYSSGQVSGFEAHETISLAGYAAPDVLVSVAQSEGSLFAGFHFDGIMGLSLIVERNHDTDLFSQIIRANPAMDPVFALYLTPHRNQQGSELSVGGYDPSKAAPTAAWHFVPVLKYPSAHMYTYWAVRMTDFHAEAAQGGASANACASLGEGGASPHCTAIVDSGTTFLAVGMRYFDGVMKDVLRGQPDCRFQSATQQYACFGTSVASFPTLRFSFGKGATFHIKPSEYVQDMGAEQGLLPRLRKHNTGNGLQFWIFGDFFMRKYYTVFDHGFMRLGFACAVGQEAACRG